MARTNGTILDTGDRFPNIEFDTVRGERLLLPGRFLNRWSVVLFYRGHW